jgi:hypothetical protein
MSQLQDLVTQLTNKNDLPGIIQGSHESDKHFKKRKRESRERAAKCHTATRWGLGKAFSLACHQFRVCLTDFRYRLIDWCKNLYEAFKLHPRPWYHRPFSNLEAEAVRETDITYLSFPLEGDQTVILSPDIEGELMPTDVKNLILLLKEWIKTPFGKRISRSKDTIKRVVGKPKEEKQMRYTEVSIPELAAVIERVGGRVTSQTATQLSYEGVEDDVIAAELESMGKIVALYPSTSATKSEEDEFECFMLPHEVQEVGLEV